MNTDDKLHPFNPQVPYNNLGSVLKKKYGERVYRIGVDAGFSCPNRGPDRDQPGCTFCAGDGNRAPYNGCEGSIRNQILESRKNLGNKPGSPQILYFQAYTSTAGPPESLDKLIQEGLDCGDWKQLVISTRPDCLEEPILAVLQKYQGTLDEVWIELGLQSAHDPTLERVHRAHTVGSFDDALLKAKEKDFKVAAHVLFGLPGEGSQEWVDTVRHLCGLGIDGIKIHNLMLIPGTPLYEDYLAGKISPLDPQEYMDACIDALEILPPEVQIMRLSADYPGEESLPGEFPEKSVFLNQLRARMIERKTWQGRLCNKT